MRRIAFDLDETLGVPLVDGANIVGWQMRPGCAQLLYRLQSRFQLVLWSVSQRRYVDKALSFGLDRWFAESHSWDELPAQWKDVRELRADWLVDDSPHHREAAARFGIAERYIVVPAYGSPEDSADPLAWARLVEAAVTEDAQPGAPIIAGNVKAFPGSPEATMDVTRWKTPAAFFPWSHVQRYIDSIDSTVYRAAIDFAKEQFQLLAKPCPQCARGAAELFWFSVSDPEAAWDAGTGRVGFLTVCEQCQVQVDFLVDKELTEIQAEQWRECRTLN